MTVGERLRMWRERSGWSQQEVSDRTGIRQAMISELETGKITDTKLSIFTTLVSAYGKTLQDLLEGEPYDDPRAADRDQVGARFSAGRVVLLSMAPPSV